MARIINGRAGRQDSILTIFGTEEDDFIHNHSICFDVEIYGNGGNDCINEDAQHNTIHGGEGEDTIYIKYAHYSLVYGDAGGDSIYTKGSSYSTIYGGDGNDTITGSASNLVYGEDGDDYISAGLNSTIYGEHGNDTISVAKRSLCIGGAGDDVLYSYTGDTTIYGGDGNDTIIGGGTNFTIDGGAGADFVSIGYVGSHSHDGIINGGNHNDSIIIDRGSYNFSLKGGSGNDYIVNRGNDVIIYTGEGNDTITGATNTGTVIKIVAGDINSAKLDGEDVVIKIGENSTRLTGVKDKEVTLVSAQGEKIKFTNSYIGVQETDTQGGGTDTQSGGGTEIDEQEIINSVNAFNTVLEIGQGTDEIPYDSSNELSKKIAKSEIDFIRWLGKVWGVMTRYEMDANGDVIKDNNGDPVEDTSTTKTMINAGYNAILTLDDIFTSVQNISSGKLTLGEIGTEVTQIADNTAKLIDYLQQFKSGDPKGGFLNDTISASLGIATNVVTCFTDGVSFPEVENILTNITKLAEQSIKDGQLNTWLTGLTGKGGVAGQKVIDFVKDGKVSTVVTGISCLFTGLDKYFKNADLYAIDGVPKSTAIINSCIDAVGGIVNVISNAVFEKILGVDADTVFQGAHTFAATLKWSFQNAWALITGGDTSQVKFTTAGDKTFTDIIGNLLKELLTGTTEAETIYNVDNKKKFYTIKGDNDIHNFGSYCTLNSGGGNDLIFCHEGTQSNYIDGGDDSDIIVFYGAANEVHGGFGNDKITAYSDGKIPLSGNVIYGEGGDDFILINDSRYTSKSRISANTISGGSGNDIVILDNTRNSNVIFYQDGDGNDTIYGYDTNDTIKISNSDYTTAKSGDNIKIQVGNGSITLMDAAGKTPKIIKTTEIALPIGVTADKKQTTLTVKNEFRAGVITLENYSETFTKVNASGLANTQTIEIYGNDSANLLKGGKGADTISGGSGNDTLTGGKGADLFIYSTGNDLITDYKPGEDKISVNYTSSSVKGSDVILTTANGNLTIKGAKDKVITFADGSEKIFYGNTSYSPLATGLKYDAKRITLTADKKFTGSTIDLNDYLSSVTKLNAAAVTKSLNLVGNNLNNSIKGGKGSDTISGGSGNDTLTGGAGKDLFVYSSGNDLITDYKAGEDKISVKYTSSIVKGSDVILTTANGNLTIKGAKDKVITFADGSEKIFYGNTSYSPLATGLKYDATRITLTADKKFTGSTIDLNDYLSSVTKINASAVTKSLNLVGNNLNNSIKGGSGADTLSGGSGNDTLTGGKGADTFIYRGGNDLITDYAAEDTIKISGTISKTTYSGKNVVFTIGSGSLTVKNGKGKNISITDSSAKTFNLFEDNNFITDTPQLSEITASKVSVTKIQDTKDELTQPQTLLTFAKK